MSDESQNIYAVCRKKKGLFGKSVEIIIPQYEIDRENVHNLYKNGELNPNILYILVGDEEKNNYEPLLNKPEYTAKEEEFIKDLKNKRNDRWRYYMETNYHEIDQERIKIKSGK